MEGDIELTESPAIVNALWLAAVGQMESDVLESQLLEAIPGVQQDVDVDSEFVTPEEQKAFAAKAAKRAVKRLKEESQELREQAVASAKLATSLAELMDTLGSTTEEGWCSRCFTRGPQEVRI